MPNVERLKLIQAIIDRMARNSFALKGWAVTLTGALLSLTAARHDDTIALIAIYVLIAMAALDAYYLALERAYRTLYDQATTQPATEWQLHASPPRFADVARALTSPSILLLYGLSLIATHIAFIAT
ncbi:MAG: hypothetical protein M3295_02020 [Chloroflexota bacterium]|nr:hypothetical protein [Chloroflexota bacterium]